MLLSAFCTFHFFNITLAKPSLCFVICIKGVAGRQNQITPFSFITSHSVIFKLRPSTETTHFHIYNHKVQHPPLLWTLHTGQLFSFPPLSSSPKQILIYNSVSYDLRKCRRLLSATSLHVCAHCRRSKTKFRRLGWFYFKSAHVFIMHRKSETTPSVKAICCLDCSFIAGEITSCFVNCRDRDTCILMAGFWMFLHFDRHCMNNFSMLCGGARVKITL